MAQPVPREIKVEPTTPEVVAPFGQLLGVNETTKPLPVGFYDGKVTIYAPVEFNSDADTQLTLVDHSNVIVILRLDFSDLADR